MPEGSAWLRLLDIRRQTLARSTRHRQLAFVLSAVVSPPRTYYRIYDQNSALIRIRILIRNSTVLIGTSVRV
eukprot:scaffold288322_cov19-Prasinocladus_malaysianus.AAC.1